MEGGAADEGEDVTRISESSYRRLRKLTMEGGFNLRKYIYVGGRLKPPEVELPPGPYIPPVVTPQGILIKNK